MLRAPDVRVVVDVGCGDWEFAQLVDWSMVTYTGLDVVPAVIAENQQRFGAPGVRFDCADINESPLPRADLLLCKDVLQHWPIGLMLDFLSRVRNRYRYVMLTNDVASVHCPSESLNADIPLGAWRIVDLEQAPFDLHADWRHDYDIRGEWTKRMLLLVSRRYRPKARLSPNSALNRLRVSGR
jgi:SAM-dependent methyltransferase